MTVKCTFCNDTKIDPRTQAQCVWCECADIMRSAPVQRHTIAHLRYAGGEEHNVKYVSEVDYDRVVAEAVRLRERCAELDTDLAGLTKANDQLINQRGEAWMERDRLRAQLAERDALLDRVVDHANFWHDHPYAEVVEAIARDYKAISASAEPSAPVEPLHPKCTVLKDVNVRYSNSTAPVERDERADFERWHIKENLPEVADGRLKLLPGYFDRYEAKSYEVRTGKAISGTYIRENLENDFAIWQARAALERKQ